LHRFFYGGIGNDDSTLRLSLLFDAAHHDAVIRGRSFMDWPTMTRHGAVARAAIGPLRQAAEVIATSLPAMRA
jgi:hypothetical protein